MTKRTEWKPMGAQKNSLVCPMEWWQNKTDDNYDRVWKIENTFDKLSDTHSKYYSLSEHLATDESIVLYKGRVIFKQ